MEMTALSDVMENRSGMYALLSRLFLDEVDETTIDRLRRMSPPPATDNHDVDEGYRLLLHAASKDGIDDARQAFAVDYAHTFIGSGTDGHSAAYPYESVHTSEKRLLMQNAFHEVVKEYREAGFSKVRRNEPEDHMGIELEFVGLLCEKTKAALERGSENEANELIFKQREFLRNHIARWAPSLVEDMLRFSQTDFYRGLALLTRGFVNQDEKLLALLAKGE